MKRNQLHIVTIAALAAILSIPIACTTGGIQTSNTTKYRTIGAAKIAVEAGMKAWANRVVDGQTGVKAPVTPMQEAKVRAAFDAWKSAAGAYIDVAIGDSLAAPPDIADAAAALVNLLAQFGVKTGGV